MAYYIIDGYAHTFGISLKIKRSGDPSQLNGILVYQSIDIFRTDARPNRLIYQIKNLVVYNSSSAYSFNLSRRFYHIVLWNLIAHDLIIFKFLVKRQVTAFVFFSASAPACIISSYFKHFYPPSYYNVLTRLRPVVKGFRKKKGIVKIPW